ncbi:MAG: HAD family hydrolase [Alphaproteobacteria bacterium]|nr:HAD family hydrolase [Alphaproteobacteria bacterium]
MRERKLPARIAAVVSDVDGTLVHTDKSLDASTVSAVARLRDAGISFAVVSARPPRGLTYLVEQLRVSTFVAAFNGGVVATADLSPVQRHPVAGDVATRAIAAIEAAGADAWVFTEQDWCIRNPSGPRVDLEKRTVRFDPVVVADFSAVARSAFKIVAVSNDPSLLSRLQNDLRGLDANIARSQTYYLDVTHPRANKGDAVRELARLMQVDVGAVAVLGDGENDVPMFHAAALSIAMGNAAPAVAAEADFVTASNNEDGAALALEWFVLRGMRTPLAE